MSRRPYQEISLNTAPSESTTSAVEPLSHAIVARPHTVSEGRFNEPTRLIGADDTIQLGVNYTPPDWALQDAYLAPGEATACYQNVYLPPSPSTLVSSNKEGYTAPLGDGQVLVGDQAIRIYPQPASERAKHYTAEDARADVVAAERQFNILQEVAGDRLYIPPRTYGIGPRPDNSNRTALYTITDHLIGESMSIANPKHREDCAVALEIASSYLVRVVIDEEADFLADLKLVDQYKRGVDVRIPGFISRLILEDIDPKRQPVKDERGGYGYIGDSVGLFECYKTILPKDCLAPTFIENTTFLRDLPGVR